LRKKSIKTGLAVLLVLVSLPALASVAQAKVKKIKAKIFQENRSYWAFAREPACVGAQEGAAISAFFTAPLSLPAGAEITGVNYWRSSATGAQTELILYKLAKSSAVSPEKLVEGTSTAATGNNLAPHMAGTSQTPGADLKIRKDSFYFLEIKCEPGSYIWQVDVEYNP